MDEQFLEAVRLLLFQMQTVDNEGYVHWVHQSFFDNLELSYKKHCRKHHISRRGSHVKPIIAASVAACADRLVAPPTPRERAVPAMPPRRPQAKTVSC